MLGFKIGNEDLDMIPGTVLEVERNNAYLQFNEEVVGDFSYPFEFLFTPTNIRLTKYAALLQKRTDPTGLDVTCWDNGFQNSIGKLKFEKTSHNLSRTQSGRGSAYYLTGISYFNQDIKDKRLRDVYCGGNREFDWDNYQRNGTGFWGHIHKVIDAPAGFGASGFDYAFYPVVNKDFTWEGSGLTLGGEVTNLMEYTGGAVNFRVHGTDDKDANAIVPFPYLKYVLRQIGLHVGWKFVGDIFDDPDFAKVTLNSLRAIDWAYFYPFGATVFAFVAPQPVISFNLSDHLPDVSIPEFLLAIRNRFGLSFDVDLKGKIVRFKKLVTVAASAVKDLTAKASPLLEKKILTEKKIYYLTTNENSGAINLSGVSYQGTVAMAEDLPAPSEARYEQVYLVVTENNYYICELNDENNTQVWEWHVFDSNTRDVVPDGATEEISTASVTTGVEKYSTYLDLVPRYDESGFWALRTDDNSSNTIMLLFYHGVRNNKAGQPYPFASQHIYDSTGAQVGNWSLSFLGKKVDGTEVGLYQLNWKPFLDKLSTSEELTVTLYLSRNEFMQLKFSDLLSIAGVRMYISKMKYTIPYAGTVQCECTRV